MEHDVLKTGGEVLDFFYKNRRVEIGDKVDFSLGNHDKKEVALKIAILPKSFPVIFDDVELDVYGFPMEFEGVITKPCLKVTYPE